MRVKAIGTIHTPFKEARGTPIQSRAGEGVEGWVEVFDEFRQGLRDLGGFERIWLVYWFNRTAPGNVSLVVTPYLDKRPHGVFATRAPARPNPIGMSAVNLVGIRGNHLRIRDVDILDGTPLLDIKPYIPQFDSFAVARSGWASRADPTKVLADSRFERSRRRGP
jgi:tRNA (adenine37-N6)-methyltransferase